MPMLELKNAGFRYSPYDPWVFRHLAFKIEAGISVRVVGRNGSGKTTLLKTLSGNLDLTEGDILPRKNSLCTYLNQFAGDMLASGMTVAEHFHAATGCNGSSAGIYVDNRLSHFGLGLENRWNDFAGHLSGGEKQIIALLCVLAAGSKILCLDEFTSALDPRSIAVVEEILTRVHSEFKTALVLVNHSNFRIKTDGEFSISGYGGSEHGKRLV